jgi:hypothetical protein
MLNGGSDFGSVLRKYCHGEKVLAVIEVSCEVRFRPGSKTDGKHRRLQTPTRFRHIANVNSA